MTKNNLKTIALVLLLATFAHAETPQAQAQITADKAVLQKDHSEFVAAEEKFHSTKADYEAKRIHYGEVKEQVGAKSPQAVQAQQEMSAALAAYTHAKADAKGKHDKAATDQQKERTDKAAAHHR